MNKELKYEYHLQTWGGFYNDEYAKIHKKVEGDFWFDTKEERQLYIDELKFIRKELNAVGLALDISEGYNCRQTTTLHRVVEWEGKRYYSTYDLGINYPFRAANYHLNWKWPLDTANIKQIYCNHKHLLIDENSK